MPPEPPEVGSLASSSRLLAEAKGGSLEARDALIARYLPAIQRFAHGRLPARARPLLETADVVQIALVRGLAHLETFERRHEGAFLTYLRQIVMNQIRDEARRAAVRPERVELPDDLPHEGRSPLEEAIGNEALEIYERALAELADRQREAVVLRLELGKSYEEIAAAMESPSANAARMVVLRGLERLAALMKDRLGHTR